MLGEGAAVKAATNAVAVAGVITPLWLPSLSLVSEQAGVWTPILGAIWLATQIIRTWFGGRK